MKFTPELIATADEIERLRAELMAVCQREAASAVRHDAKLDALEHEIRNLTNRIEQLRDALAIAETYVDISYHETDREEAGEAKHDLDRVRAALKETER